MHYPPCSPGFETFLSGDAITLLFVLLQDEILGHIRIPLTTIERRVDGRPVASR